LCPILFVPTRDWEGHAQLMLPSRLWRIEVRYLCTHVRPENSD
jgi:hypothetical protein